VKYLNVPGSNLPAEAPRAGYPTTVANSALSHADPTELNLAKYFSILRKNIWVIAGIVMCSTLVSVMVSIKSPKIYEAITKINVERATPQIMTFKDLVNDSFDYEMFIETQLRILQSNTVALQTIDGMHLASNEGFVGKQAGPAPDPLRPRSEAETNGLIGRFLGDLRVTRIRGSQIVEIHFMCFDPVLAAKIADQLAENYINHNLETKVQGTIKASEWLQRNLDELRVKLDKSEEALVAYERANSILMLSNGNDDHSTTKDRLDDANKQLMVAESDRRAAESKWKVLQQSGPTGLIQDSSPLSTLQAKLSEASQVFEEAQREYDVNHPKYIKAKAQREAAQTDLDREVQRQVSQVQAQFQLTEEKEQSIRKMFADVKGEAQAESNKLIEYNILKRDVDSYRDLYNNMETRLKEARIGSGLSSSNISIVDRAQVPGVPSLPRTGQNISLGIVVGLMMGLAASFLRDFLDNTVKTPDDVEQMAGLPNLGVIPGISPGLVRAAYYSGYGLGKSKHKELAPGETETLAGDKDTKAIVGLCRPETVTLSHPHSSIAESFRALRTALLLANSGMPPRTILVTSGLPSEGKTTIAINVAITLAQRGGRVLLVDADLRRPSVHRHLMGSRKSRDEMPGLSHYLTGNSPLSDCIQPSGLIPNLEVMMAGSIPPNPAELCSSEPMRKLLHDLREEYSHVIIDSPPLLSVTDSTILSVQTDGVLLVSRSGFSTRDSLRRAKKLLEHVNSRLLGVVLNDLNLAVDGYYYYYYYGYYGYGRPDRETANVPGN